MMTHDELSDVALAAFAYDGERYHSESLGAERPERLSEAELELLQQRRRLGLPELKLRLHRALHVPVDVLLRLPLPLGYLSVPDPQYND